MTIIKKIITISLFSLLPLMGFADNLGEKVYTKGGENPMAIACMTCHGMGGEGLPAAGYPNIAGKSSEYLSKQVYDFKAGDRAHPVMDGVAAALSDDEINAVSVYMESLPAAEIAIIPRATTPTDIGSQLALRGDWSRNIPECIACHGPSGVGVGDAFPKLAGQSELYIVNQMNAWKNGTRQNDPDDLMGHIARSLNEDEIQAVATYFSNLGSVGK